MISDLRKLYQGSFADRYSDLGAVGYSDYASYTSSTPAYTNTTPTASDLSAGGSNQLALAASTTLPAITDTSSTPATTATSSTATSQNPFTAILTALGVGAATVASGAITGAVLTQTNAQRLAQGLPPLTASGQVMTAAQMAAAGYSTAQIAAVQSQLGIDPETLMIVAAVGIGAFLLLSGKRS
jgi:uncharacterized protein YkwD